jgi:hypothetical protein
MKKYLFLVLALAIAAPLWAQTASTKANGPVMTFEKSSHDFGDIKAGAKVQEIFRFTNTGNEPLIITNVEVSCGCTAPKWPRDPIAPGGKGEIVVAFNSEGKSGAQNKVVKVISNANNSEDALIKFKANVLTTDTTQ